MSNLTEELDRYLAIRRSLGYALRTDERILRRFIAFIDHQGTEHVTTDLFLQWKGAFGKASRQTWAHRLGTVRIFAQWLKGMDSRNEVTPRGLIPNRNLRTCPYIYSEQEIGQILAEADRLPSVNGIRALTY